MSLLEDDLIASVRAGDVVVVAGSGVSASATAMAPESTWSGLLLSGVTRVEELGRAPSTDWAARARQLIGGSDLSEMLAAAELLSSCLGGPLGGEWSRWLRETAGKLSSVNSAVPQAVARLNSPVLTTNYDGLLDDAIGGRPATWTDARRLQRIVRQDERAVGHLHGYWDEPESVVLGIRSYEKVLGDKPTQALQQAITFSKTILFVGFGAGLDDPNWSALRDFMRVSLGQSEYRHYRLCLDSELPVLKEEHRDDTIHPIAYGSDHGLLPGFLDRLSRHAPSARADSTLLRSRLPHSAAIIRVGIAVLIQDSKVVLVQRQYREGDLEWTFPSQFINPYRDARVQVCRGVSDETGLQVRIAGDDDFLGERVHPVTGVNAVYYTPTILSGDLVNGDTSENLTVAWIEVNRVHDYIPEDQIFEPVKRYLAEAIL